MNIKIPLFLFIILSLLSQVKSQDYTKEHCFLIVNIAGLENEKARIGIWPFYGDGKQYKKTTKLRPGKLIELDIPNGKVYRGRILSKDMYFNISGKPLWLKNRTVNFYIEANDTLTINGKLKEYSIDYRITGNRISEQYSEYVKEYLPLFEEENKKVLEYTRYKRENADKEQMKQIGDERWAINKKVWLESLKFVEQHPDYDYSAFLISPMYLSVDSMILYKNLLHKKVFNSDFGLRLIEIIERRLNEEKLSINTTAINFKFTASNGIEYELADFKGKYVVLDFWGTWCAPCIQGIPNMKKYHTNYKNRIEFIGIACKDNKEDWKRFISKYSLDWLQVLNGEGETDLAFTYGIDSYPTKILIDKNGDIVGRFVGETDRFYQEIDIILKN